MTKTLSERKQISDMLVSWLGVLSLIIGGTFTLYQWSEAKSKSRIEHTLAYVKQFNGPEMSTVRTAISSHSEKVSIEFEKLRKKHSDPKNPEDVKIIKNFIVRSSDEKGIRENIWHMVGFYESLVVCVDNKICDVETAEGFMGSPALKFYRFYSPYIDQVRRQFGDTEYGGKLHGFTKSYYNRTVKRAGPQF